MIKLFLLISLLPTQAFAARAIMEGIKATNNTVFFDTGTARTNLNATGYSAGVPNVGLNVGSNVVVSVQGSNNCVIYSSGSISCIGTISGSASGSNPWARSGVTISPTNSGDTVLFTGPTNNLQPETNHSSTTFKASIKSEGINRWDGQNNFEAAASFHQPIYIGAVSTAGPQGFNTAVTNSSGTLSNVPFKVASANPSATSSSFTITGLQADKQYHLVGDVATTIAGYFYMRFNQDTGATVYDWTYQGINSNAGAAVFGGDNSDPMCRLNEASMAASVNTRGILSCDIFTGPDYGWAMCDVLVEDANPSIEKTHASCRYNVATPTSIQIAVTGAGNITGKFYLTELK